MSPELPLETEPLVFFHPTLVGLSPPGTVQPFHGPLLLEEEPAVWPELGGDDPWPPDVSFCASRRAV